MDSSFYYRRPSPSPSLQDAAAAAFLPSNSVAAAAAAPDIDMLKPDNDRASGIRRRPRVSRKHERHSKICTAGGMRDRRMRLSMDVARRFFALQDKLCFDKASKTVQWLLDMSKPNIDDLSNMSEDGSVFLQDDLHTMQQEDSSDRNNKLLKGKKKKTFIDGSSSSTTKESRARARERARERTRERNCLRWSSSVPAAPLVNQQAEPPLFLPSPSEAAAACSYNVDEQLCQDQPWELSGVVFAKPHHFHSTHG